MRIKISSIRTLCFLLIVALFTLSSCYDRSNKEEMEQGALEYLENKYKESFRIVDTSIPNWSSNKYTYTVVATEGDYKEQQFEVYEHGDDKGRYLDTYINIIKQKEYLATYQSLADEFFTDALVYGEILSSYNLEFTKEMTMEDAIGIVYGAIDILVPKDSITKSQYEDACNTIKERLTKEGSKVYLRIRCLTCDKSEVSTQEKYEECMNQNTDIAKIYQWEFTVDIY